MILKPFHLPSLETGDDERQAPNSPFIRKLLPQTSILIAGKKNMRNLRKSEDLESSDTFFLDNDIEILSLPNKEKVVITKQLRLLYNEIISFFPSLKLKKDSFEYNSEVYKYIYTQNFKKIRSVADISASDSYIYLSKRHRMHKNEFIKENKKLQQFKSYQIINFNQSIQSPKSSRIFSSSNKKVPRILRSPDKIVEIYKNDYEAQLKRRPLPVKINSLPGTLDIKEKKLLNKYKKPSNMQKKGKNLNLDRNNSKKHLNKPEVLNIPPKLYYELMRIPDQDLF
jgi:hypothetical protein